jgi:hypothetical protein
VAQVRRNAYLGHGDAGLFQYFGFKVIARQHFGKALANNLAHAQLTLARPTRTRPHD